MTLRFFWFLSDPLKCSGLAWFSPLHDVTMYHFWTNPSNTRSPRIQFSDSQVPHRENAKQILSAIGRSSQCCEIVHHEMLVYFFVNLGGAMCQTQSEKPSEPSSGLWKLVHEIHTSRYPTTHVFSYHYHCRLSWLILSRIGKNYLERNFHWAIICDQS